MEKWVSVLSIMAAGLISVLLLRSGQPSVCINSNIVQDISISGSALAMKNCDDPDHALESFKPNTSGLSFWQMKKMASSVEAYNFIFSRKKTKRLHIQVDQYAKNKASFKGHTLAVSPSWFKQDKLMAETLIVYWLGQRFKGNSVEKKSAYKEILLSVVLGHRKYARNFKFWSSEIELKNSKFKHFIADLVRDYYLDLSEQDQFVFKSRFLNLSQKEDLKGFPTMDFKAQTSFSVKRESIRIYVHSLIEFISGSQTQKLSFDKIMRRYGLSADILSISASSQIFKNP